MSVFNGGYIGLSEIIRRYQGLNLMYDSTDTALTPIMINFRVLDSNEDRVYFDTPLGSVAGIAYADFTINGKTITGVDTVNNYFTVSSAFTYWQKGYTIKKTTDDTVYGFTMEHIDNQIAEPTATGTSYYVRISGNDSNDGLSLNSAWLTLTHADDSTSAGDTIYVKEGVYNEDPSAFSSSGTVSNPKKWIGFISDPTANGGQGDIVDMYYNDYDTDTISTSEMPTITGSGQTDSNHGFDITGQFHIFKNFQATGFDQHFRANSGNVVFERCLAYDSVNETFHSKVRGFNTGGSNASVIDCRVRNMARSAFYHGGSYNLIKDCKAWCDNTVSVNQSMDYYFGIYNASNNVIKDCYGRRTNNSVPHGGHSCSVESDTGWGVTTDNLIDGLESVNIRAMEWRAWSEDNVAKNLNHYPLSGDTGSRGVYDRDGNRNNILENSKIEVSGGQEGIFYWNTDEGWNGLADNNTYRNNVFIGNGAVFLEINDQNGGSPALTNNKYYNNTIDGFGSLITVAGSPSISGNEFKGNLIDATSLGSGSGFSFDYNNFTGGIGEQGTNSSAVDPNFVDTVDYKPQTDSLIRLPKITDINYDRLGNERANPTTLGGVLSNKEVIRWSVDTGAEPIISYPVTTSSLGMVEDNESEALNNANKLIAGIKAHPEGIDVNGSYFIQTPSTTAANLGVTEIRLSSTNGGELKSNETGDVYLFTSQNITDIEVGGVTFSNSNGGSLRLFYYSTDHTIDVNLIKFNSNFFVGDVYICRKSGDGSVDPSLYSIADVQFRNNTVRENRAEMAFFIVNDAIDKLEIVNNEIHNTEKLFEIYVGNTSDYLNERYYARPLFTITDNYMHNDIDFECNNTRTYNTLGVFESDEVDYLRNHVEGIWTTSDLAVYDVYLSSNVVRYKDNVNKNNVMFFSVDDYANTLMKSKGSATDYGTSIRNYEDNHFIVEESWVDAVALLGANKSYSSVNLYETGGNNSTASIYIKNNTFDIYSSLGNRGSVVNAINYEVSGNSFKASLSNNIFTETISMNDSSIPESVIFSNNTFDIKGTTSQESVPAMCRVMDFRTSSTDKIGSFIFNNNTGICENVYMLAQQYAENFEMIGNNLVSNTTEASAWWQSSSFSEVSNASNNTLSFNSAGSFTTGFRKYGATSIVDEDVTFNGTPRVGYGQQLYLEKGLPSSPSNTIRRTYNIDDGDEIFYFEFTLSYDTDHWNVTFTNTSDVEVTYRLNNNDGITDGTGTSVKVVNSGVSTTSKTIVFNNANDGECGFTQNIGTSNIKLNIKTINI